MRAVKLRRGWVLSHTAPVSLRLENRVYLRFAIANLPMDALSLLATTLLLDLFGEPWKGAS